MTGAIDAGDVQGRFVDDAATQEERLADAAGDDEPEAS